MSTNPRVRLSAIDAVRGIAVIAMIQWHSAHAWVGRANAPPWFETSEFIGGLGAPLFFFLAGVSLALHAERTTLSAQVLRGLNVIAFGYGLNLWAWAIDRSAILRVHDLPIVFVTSLAVTSAYLATSSTSRSTSRWRHPPVLVAVALCSIALTTALLCFSRPSARALLLRVDVLQAIGAALIITAIALRATNSVGMLLGLGFLVSAATVWLAGAPVSWIPDALLEWLVARPGSSGGFPLVPWLAYSLCGAALGVFIRQSPVRNEWILPRTGPPALAFALGVSVATWIAWGMPHAPRVLIEEPTLARSMRLVFQIARIAAAFGLVGIAAPRLRSAFGVLTLLGRHSLLIYAVHLEFVYGLLAAPLRRSADTLEWVLGMLGLVIAMTLLAEAIEWRARRRQTAHSR